jgi:hypothetical protein
MTFPRTHLRLPIVARLRSRIDLRGWIVVAWVLWWSWCYFQMAVLPRFPHLATWTRWPW